MSTLRLDTIQDQGGNNASTPNEIYSGRAKAWVNFDGTTGSGTGFSDMTIRGSFNVSSITDGGPGFYTVNFETSMPDANYCSVVTGTGANTNAGHASHDSSGFNGAGTNLGTASGFNIRTVDGSNNVPTDHEWVTAAVFR